MHVGLALLPPGQANRSACRTKGCLAGLRWLAAHTDLQHHGALLEAPAPGVPSPCCSSRLLHPAHAWP